LLWVDEAAFYLLPMAVRTYAPRGETPELRVKQTHEHLSAISAVSHAGQLVFHLQDESFHSEEVVAFLQHLLYILSGPLVVIWDNASIHRSQVIKEFLQTAEARRLHLEALPSYAPDLNPDEGVWNWLKGVALKNQCFADLPALETSLWNQAATLAANQTVLLGCITECGYSL
jgi:hypothetical protein